MGYGHSLFFQLAFHFLKFVKKDPCGKLMLQQIVKSAVAHGIPDEIISIIVAENKDFCFAVLLLKLLCDLNPVFIRHVDVKDQDIRFEFINQLQTVCAAQCLAHYFITVCIPVKQA